MCSGRRQGSLTVVSASSDIYKLQTLDRAFAVLDLLASSSALLAVAEVVDALHLHKSTAHRLLKVLERHRMVERAQNGKYRLGLRLCNLGSRAIEQYDLRDRAYPHLRTLVSAVAETAHLCILEKMHLIYIDKQEPEQRIRMISRVGASSPIYCTAVGKAILATMPRARVEEMLPQLDTRRFTRRTITSREALLEELERTKRRGYAVDDEEREEGVRCAGVAIFNARGEAIAALSISGPSFRMTMQKIPRIVCELMTCAQGIQQDLRYTPRFRQEEMIDLYRWRPGKQGRGCGIPGCDCRTRNKST
jgi:DNA-binding IclR family transcriptional regulator